MNKMITLHDIKNIRDAVSNTNYTIDIPVLDSLLKHIDDLTPKEELKAWQIILGNLGTIIYESKRTRILYNYINEDEIKKLAKNRAISYRYSTQHEPIIHYIKIYLDNKEKHYFYLTNGKLHYSYIIIKGTDRVQLIKKYYDSDTRVLKEKYKLVNNLLNGEYLSYHKNGKIEYHSHYNDGKLIGPYRYYYDNGQLNTQCNYIYDKLFGAYIVNYQDGTLKLRTQFLAGEPDGIWMLYYTNGMIQESRFYKNGKMIDKNYHYNNDGTINKIMECINGVPLPVASVFDIPISELKQIL